ncbi:hypothetical protein [Blastococcus deserti]|uniref:Uncharacterized protein n=1 Tax=Blastococcus deserti TaxID=2259033 RepID=A0ABW4XIR0_9ACTN
MTDNPYAIPVDELVPRARVPLAEQVEVEPAQFPADPSAGVPLHGDGGDADGE